MLSTLRKRRRLSAIRAKQQRLHQRQRMWMMERLEVRASPGSMLVDVLTLAGHPMAGARHAAQAMAMAESSQSARTTTEQAPTIGHDRSPNHGDQPVRDHESQSRAHELRRLRTDSDRSVSPTPESAPSARDRSAAEQRSSNANRLRAASTETTAAFSTGLDDPLAELLDFQFTTDTDSSNHDLSRAPAGLGGGSASSQSPDPALEPPRESP